MKKLELKIETEQTENFKYALQETIKQLENGYTSGDLRNEDIKNGYWEIINLTCKHSNCDDDAKCIKCGEQQ